jgi:inner membrane transporter RhtA
MHSTYGTVDPTLDGMTTPVEAPPLSAENATARDRTTGLGLMLAGSASNQVGAAIGALAFPVIGPVGVVAVRQLTMAALLTPVVRPRLHRMTRAQWLPVLGLALSFSVMNLGLYASVSRIGLGLAVTLEFLGPLAVAILASRRAIDLGCALLAGVGVLVLTAPGPSTDYVGIALGLAAACAWAAYILLNRSVGQRIPGLQGTAAAGVVTAGIWAPVAVVWFWLHPPTVPAIGLAVACGLLASVVPYVADLLALRRVPTHLFSTLSSIHPVWAALAGWVVLGQLLGATEWIGLGLIVLANLIVSARGVRGTRR